MSKKCFIAMAVVFAILSIFHIYVNIASGDTLLSIITKGLPVVLLFVCELIWGRKHPRLIVALLFSFLGDYAAELGLPGHTSFHLQIIFFSLAQLHYILEFVQYWPKKNKSEGKLLSITPILCGIYAFFVVGDVVVTSLQKRDKKWIFVLGAVLFLISDSLILLRILHINFEYMEIAVMGTYYLAQYTLNYLALQAESNL